MQILLFWIFRGVQNYVTIYLALQSRAFCGLINWNHFVNLCLYVKTVLRCLFFTHESRNTSKNFQLLLEKKYYKNHLKNNVFMKYHLFTKILPHHENIQLLVNINFLPWLKCFFLCDCHEQKTSYNIWKYQWIKLVS